MDRRDALRLLATGAALQLAPRNLLVVLREARAQLVTPVALRTLNPHQDATVKAMAEFILPKTDTPGATDVGAGEFIDLMLTEWYDEQDRAREAMRRIVVRLGKRAKVAIIGAVGEGA